MCWKELTVAQRTERKEETGVGGPLLGAQVTSGVTVSPGAPSLWVSGSSAALPGGRIGPAQLCQVERCLAASSSRARR